MEENINEEFIKDESEHIINVVDKINNNIILFSLSGNRLKIKSKSLKKIMSFMDSKENLSDIYIDYIVLNIVKSYKKIKENKEDNNYELELKYQNILSKTIFFNINIEKNKYSTLIKFFNKIKIHRSSLLKIFKYLNSSIIKMSDYIFILILLIQDDDNNKNIKDNSFIKQFKIDFEKPSKSQEQDIYKYDIMFTNVLNYIDDEDNDSSFSGDIYNISTPKKNIDENCIIAKDVPFLEVEEGILTDRDINNINNNNDKNKKDNDSEEFETVNPCDRICNIF